MTQYPLRDRYSMRAVEDYRSLAQELFTLGCPDLLDAVLRRPDLVPRQTAPRHLHLLGT